MVTGSSQTAWGAYHVFVWERTAGKLIDLGIGPSGNHAENAKAIAINARGDIIGIAYGTQQPTRAILWRRKQ